MERIKKALEKAREMREGGAGSPDSQDNAVAHKDIEEIKYTQTSVVKIPRQMLSDHHVITDDNSTEYIDSIKILRTQVMQRMVENNWNTLAITSAGDSEGKTLTAINLGLNIAKDVGYTVLLVDANLQTPGVHRTLGIKPEYGLSDYLVNDVPLNKIFIKPDGFGDFSILPSGGTLKNSAEMLGSPRMKALVEELKTRYPKRIILFDVPPMLGKADTMAFIPYVDASLLVIEDGVTKESDLKKTVELLSNGNIIGSVLNKS